MAASEEREGEDTTEVVRKSVGERRGTEGVQGTGPEGGEWWGWGKGGAGRKGEIKREQRGRDCCRAGEGRAMRIAARKTKGREEEQRGRLACGGER